MGARFHSAFLTSCRDIISPALCNTCIAKTHAFSHLLICNSNIPRDCRKPCNLVSQKITNGNIGLRRWDEGRGRTFSISPNALLHARG